MLPLCRTMPTRSRSARARCAGPCRAPTRRRRRGSGSPRGSRPSSSCRRRWGRAGRTPRHGRPRSRPRDGLVLAVGLAQVADQDHRSGSPRASCQAGGCGARASTSARTRPDCWSPSGRRVAARGHSQRAFLRLVPGKPIAAEKLAARRPDRRVTGADGPRVRGAQHPDRRHRGDPRRAQPRRAVRGRGARGGRRGRGPVRRGGGTPGLRRRDADAPARAAGDDRRRRRRRRLERARDRDGRRRRQWSASFRIGSGILADRYLRSDPPSSDELADVRRQVDGGSRASTRRPSTSSSPSAAARRRCGAWSAPSSATRRSTAASGARREPRAPIAERLGLHPERVRLLPAGLTLLDEASRVLRPRRCRSRRAACARASSWTCCLDVVE